MAVEDKQVKLFFEHWRRHLNEGGNIFKGQTDKIPLEFIQPTLDKYYEELNRLFPAHRDVFTKFEPVGSVGKKPFPVMLIWLLMLLISLTNPKSTKKNSKVGTLIQKSGSRLLKHSRRDQELPLKHNLLGGHF